MTLVAQGLIYIVHLVGYFHSCITMHGLMNVKFTTTHMFLCMSRQKHVYDYNFNICSYKHLNVKENTRSWNLREGAIDRTVSKPRFGRGYGSVARQIRYERMKCVQDNDKIKMFYNSTGI